VRCAPNCAPSLWVLTLARYLSAHHPDLNLIVEPHSLQALASLHPDRSYPNLILAQPGDEPLLSLHTELVITVGGDGTVLHTSNLFGSGECPAVLSFSLGSLGFLLPFRSFILLRLENVSVTDGADVDTMKETIEMALKGPVTVLDRMRLSCTPVSENGEVLNCGKDGK